MPKTILQKLNEVEKLSQQSSQLEGNFNDLSTSIEILSDVILDSNRTLEEKLKIAKEEFSKKINEVKKMPGTPGKDGKDGRDGNDGLDGLDGNTISPDEIKTKLMMLTGDARIDKESIKGLEDMIYKSDLDRAVSILDSRTSFLINKINNLNISSAWSSITGTPTEVAYFDLAGNGTSDSMFIRDPNTKESVFGFETYATGAVNDGSSQEVVWRADNVGAVGNAITLTFDGVIDTDTALATWNAANPSNTASVIGGTGNFVPDPGTTELSGGGQAGYELAHNFLGQGIQFAGTLFSDGALSASLNGVLNSQDGMTPFIGSFNFGANESSIIQLAPDGIGISVSNATDDSRIELNADRFIFETSLNGVRTGISSDSIGNLRLKVSDYTWYWPSLDGSNGDVLTTDGSGNLSFQPAGSGAALTEKYIGVGDSSNLLTGYTNFQYNQGSYKFTQLVPNNVNGGTAIGSPLSFGTPTWNGIGNDNLTLNWSVSNYQSKKYGGNLTMTMTVPGSLDWIFTGPYSEVISSGTVPVVSGTPFNLSDTNGNTIAEVTMTGVNTGGEQWSAGTSLGAIGWGQQILDSDGHVFVKVETDGGQYNFGDDNAPNPLAGNGTSLRINDQIAELGLYAKRYFRIEHPDVGTYTAVLADLNSKIWYNYGIFRVADVGASSVIFNVDSAARWVQMGDVQSSYNDTVFEVIDTSEQIIATTDGAFTIRDTLSNVAFISEPSIFRTRIGDVMSAINDTVLDVNDNAKTISLTGGIATSRKRNGGNSTPIVVAQGDYIVYPGSGSIGATIQLPAASSLEDGTTFIIKDTYGLAATNGFIIDPSGSETIDGAGSYTLTQAYESVTLVLDKGAGNWMRI